MSPESVNRQLLMIRSVLSFYTKSFKQIGILHAFNINLLAGQWIERDENNFILIDQLQCVVSSTHSSFPCRGSPAQAPWPRGLSEVPFVDWSSKKGKKF